MERETPLEWFDEHIDPQSGKSGLRFGCTMCGNCCSGPPGYVLVTEEETQKLAARLGLDTQTFIDQYTHQMSRGTSLNERLTPEGSFDCVFLDRTTIPGRAVCGVYEDRPQQCRTWPFWTSIIRDQASWDRARRRCPGINTGTLVPPEQIRILRDKVQM